MTAFQFVGEIAVEWNRIESEFDSFLGLYLGTDQLTLEIITKKMRPNDRETLLKRLVEAKEPSAEIRAEVLHAISLCGLCRKNRNTILHTIGSTGAEISEDCAHILMNFSTWLPGFRAYLRSLLVNVGLVVADRDSREIYEDDKSDEMEERPFPEFLAPQRPERPRELTSEDITQ